MAKSKPAKSKSPSSKAEPKRNYDRSDDPATATGNYTASEWGYPKAPPSPPGDLPPGGGHWSVPNILSFQGLITTASRSYLYSSDEALLDNPANARAMRRDPVLMGALRSRQRPTSQLSWHIDPEDETDPAEIEASQIVTKIMEKIPNFQKLRMYLLEAIWFGKYASQILYEWNDQIIPGKKVLAVRGHRPVNGDKLRFKWDDTPGILVYGGYPGSWEATDWGMAHFLTPEEREQFIIHKYEPDDSDWNEPRMAGAIEGVGVRGRLYWWWWLKQQVFALLMNYLERFSNGLTIFYYQAGNPQSEEEARQAAQQQFSQTALLYPRWNSENPDANKVERLEVGTASPALLQGLVTDYFDMVSVRFIRGESPYIGPDGGARGGGDMAALASEGLDEVIKYDAVDVAETMQTDLVNVLYKYNCPGVRPGKFSFEVDTPNAQEVLKYAESLYQMGVGLSEDQLLEISQLQKPKPGDAVVSQMGPMQPAAVGNAPQGVPVTGQPGMAGPPQDGTNGMAPQDPQMTVDYQAMQGPPPGMMPYNRGVPKTKRRSLPRRKLTLAR